MKKKPNLSFAGAAEQTARLRNHYVHWMRAEIACLEKHYREIQPQEIARIPGKGVSGGAVDGTKSGRMSFRRGSMGAMGN